MNTQMNYHHLRYFLSVARCGGITPATRQLNVSAPTLSTQIRELEGFFEKPLFLRHGRSLELTETGRLLMGYAERIFSLGDEMIEVVQRGGAPGPGTVFLGVSDGVPKLLVARLLKEASSVAGDFRCVVREGLPHELWEELASHRIDLVLANETPPAARAENMPGHRIGRMRVEFAAARSIASTFHRRQCLSELPVLVPARESPLRRELEQWWASLGERPMIRAEFDDAAAMFELAAHGFGAAPVHEPVAGDVCRRYGLQRLRLKCDIEDDIFIVTHSRQFQTAAISGIATCAKKLLDPAAPRRSRKRLTFSRTFRTSDRDLPLKTRGGAFF
jgi:LysR family transcriptional activator of nhaA